DWHGLAADRLLEKMMFIKALRLQEAEKQNHFKLSFYHDADQDWKVLDAQISVILSRAGVAARLVWSLDDLTGGGLLDVLPERASKRHAIEFLMRQHGFDTGQTVFCGDSGNDIEVLISPIPAVLVANAREEVRQQAEQGSREQGNERALYIARGGFLGMNGNYRGGMLEGIVHFYPEMENWLPVQTASGEQA
ncbi:MAG: HAD family hydrolase, partial [Lysobacterales bacterium]